MISRHEAEEHGRHLAVRVMKQARTYGLGPEDVTVMVTEDIERHTRAMEADGRSAKEIREWTDTVRGACTLWGITEDVVA
jgi:hypothetical protein